MDQTIPRHLSGDARAGVGFSELREGLVATLRSGRWDRARLREMAETYGTKATLAVVNQALLETESTRS